MSGEASAYGLWALVVINSAIFILFAFSFFKPKTKRDWRSFGAFSAFLVALFTEMYGFPLTLYLFSGWLQSRYPGIDWFTHDAGHLTEMLFGWKANPHFGPFHLLSFLLIGGGFALIAAAWRVLFAAQRAGRLAVTGPYARIRHPQYAGFILIMLGFLVQWPTLLTLAMFPVLVWMYVRLARQEERDALAHFGTVYAEYQRRVPAFIPRLVRSAGGGAPVAGRPTRCGPQKSQAGAGQGSRHRERKTAMSRNIKAFATAFAVLLSAASLAEAATVYIPEGSAGEVAIVDTTKDAIVGRITDLPSVHGLGGSPAGRYLVAGSYEETPAGGETVPKPEGVTDDEHAAHHSPAARPAAGAVSILTIIDAADGSPVRRLEVPGAVHHVAVSPDGRFAVATHPNADGISVIDLEELSVGELVRTGPMPNYAAFSANGTRLYISNAGNGTVSEIDTERWFVTRNMLAGETPEHLVLSPDGRTLFVADVVAGIVQELDIEAGVISRSFEIGGELHGLDITEDAATLFVGGKGEDKLVAIDLRSGAMRSAPLAPAPYHLAVVPGTGKLYVSSRDEPKVWVVDQESLAPQGTIALRGEGHQMVMLP